MDNEGKVFWSRDEEEFNCDSLEELLDNFEDIEVGQTVWYGEAVKIDPSKFCTAAEVIERIGDAGYDYGGEWAEDYPDVSEEAIQELDNFLVAWINKHCQPTFYRIKNIKTHTITAEEIAEARK